jgi:DNA-directed RNA polymerase specialized sigma24 family protein
MSLNHGPTIDDLLADTLVQAVMRADHVKPQALKTLLNGVASRIAAARRERPSRRPAVVFVGSATDRRTPSRGGNAPPAARRAGPVRDTGCGSALCC